MIGMALNENPESIFIVLAICAFYGAGVGLLESRSNLDVLDVGASKPRSNVEGTKQPLRAGLIWGGLAAALAIPMHFAGPDLF
ncbi:hypothetical protein BH11PSE2_BH11PSE2_20390 [soil metagenome]